MKLNEILSLSPQQILNLQKNKTEFDKVLKMMERYARNRIENLKKRGWLEYSPATANRRIVKIRDINDPTKSLNDFVSLQRFLQTKTSTVKGFQKYQRDTLRRLDKYLKEHSKDYREKTKTREGKKKYSILNASVKDQNRFWKAYHKFKDSNEAIVSAITSDIVQMIMANHYERTGRIISRQKLFEECERYYEATVDD